MKLFTVGGYVLALERLEPTIKCTRILNEYTVEIKSFPLHCYYRYIYIYIYIYIYFKARDSVVGIETCCGQDGLWIESR
jgi:hypothetical protein